MRQSFVVENKVLVEGMPCGDGSVRSNIIGVVNFGTHFCRFFVLGSFCVLFDPIRDIAPILCF